MVPTISRSPSSEKLIEVIVAPTSTQSTTLLCLMLNIQVILSKHPVAKMSSLPGLNETQVTKEGRENM